MTEEESVYSKGLLSPACHSILPGLIQTPGGGGREGGGGWTPAPCEPSLTCSHGSTCYRNTFTESKASCYVNPPRAEAAIRSASGGERNRAVRFWNRVEGFQNISCCLRVLRRCLHDAFFCVAPQAAEPPSLPVTFQGDVSAGFMEACCLPRTRQIPLPGCEKKHLESK